MKLVKSGYSRITCTYLITTHPPTRSRPCLFPKAHVSASDRHRYQRARTHARRVDMLQQGHDHRLDEEQQLMYARMMPSGALIYCLLHQLLERQRLQSRHNRSDHTAVPISIQIRVCHRHVGCS